MNIVFLKTRPLIVLFAILISVQGQPKSISYAQSAQPLLQKSNLTYQGAFRLPSGQFGQSSFGYGGTALAYNPANNSLFLVGHDWHQMVAEISIPQIKNSNQLSDLATATVLQPFTDATEGKMSTVDSGTIKVGGLMVYSDQLVGTVYSYYDADGSQTLSHFISSLELSQTGDVQGMYQVSNFKAGFVSGYMAAIPQEWQESLGGPAITGNCCLSIISRTSFGPAAFAFNPDDLGKTDPVPSTPLVYYPSDNPTIGKWDSTWDGVNILFNGTSRIKGIVFPSGTRSILFIGKQGIGEWCYGSGGTSGGACYDPTKTSKGTHAYPYVNQVWAYDALDLISVKNGGKQPWDIKPYSVWNFSLPFETESRDVRGAAYDPSSRQLFISQSSGDGDRPIIHIFTVNISISADNPPPNSPTNLKIR